MGRSTTLCSLKLCVRLKAMPPISLGISAAFLGAINLVHKRKSLAPAVFANLTVDHLAGFRAFEQRAVGAAINTIWRSLILRLLPRHFFRRMRPGNLEQKPRRNPLYDRAYDL